MTVDLKLLAQDLFDLNLTAAELAVFDQYSELIVEWNSRSNLTAITSADGIRVRHFLDSLSLLLLPNIPEAAHVMDMGTGAGLPGLALAIMRPSWYVTLVDSTAKKVTFLQHVIDSLGLKNVTALQGRAEELGQQSAHRETYDLVVARALARMPTLVEYLLPFCALGGQCIAMKGETVHIETRDALLAIETLGGQLKAINPVHLPDIPETHYLVCMQKVKPTPVLYPRRVGLPSKSPVITH